MSTILGATLLVVGFIAVFEALGLVPRGREAVDRARRSVEDLRSPELDDLQKEKVLQAHSLRLFSLFLQLALGGAAAVLLPAALVWLLAQTGLVSFAAVLELAVSWEFVLVSAVAATGILVFLARR
jgi:hypothetical protein